MASKITKKQAEGLFEIQAAVRTGCFAPRKATAEILDPEPIVDIVGGQPDTLTSALDRINRGSMTYEEFQTLHGGDFDYDNDEAIPDDFDEGEFYESKEERHEAKYYDRDREARILVSEQNNESKNTSSGPEVSAPVDKPNDKSDKE